MCSLERHGDLWLLRLTGDSDHRLSPALCEDIISKLAIVGGSDAKALVTTNDGKYFSNGLDLAWVSGDPATRTQVQGAWFDRLVDAVMRVRMPTLAAVCGHAAAGGFILAMAHDHRHMRSDRGFLYMSEIDVDIVIGPRLMALLRYKMAPRALKEVVLKGLKLTAAAAADLGLVDAVHASAAATLAAAMAEAAALAARNWRRDVYLGLRLSMYPAFLPTPEEEGPAGAHAKL